MRFVSSAIAIALGVTVGHPAVSFAAESTEAFVNNGTQIGDNKWDLSFFPGGIPWGLHAAGVINNAPTPTPTLADTQAEIDLAFQVWSAVPESALAATYTGTTATSSSGCDFENVVTWSDSPAFWAEFGEGVIAAGVTTTYVGPTVRLTDAVRARLEFDNIGESEDIPGPEIACTGELLPASIYPNGRTLRTGTIVDMDMTFNAQGLNFATSPDSSDSVADIRAVAIHEFGHLFGFAHSSLDVPQPTMFPSVDIRSVTAQNNIRTLEPDDRASAVLLYPAGGPTTTGAISGTVVTDRGVPREGVRVWAYPVPSTPGATPVGGQHETFTATSYDVDGLRAGEYRMTGLPPGEYYVCILPWAQPLNVRIPPVDDPRRYNRTTIVGSIPELVEGSTMNPRWTGTGINWGFPTECYEDVLVDTVGRLPRINESDRLRRIEVRANETTPSVDFVTGQQTTDFMLVMDGSGSMNGASGTPGVSKVRALRNAADVFIGYLDLSGGHRLGLVQFYSQLRPLMPVFNLQELDTPGKVTDAQNSAASMSANGTTNIIEGVNEALRQLAPVTDPRRQVIMVFSDGKHNTGGNLETIRNPVVNSGVTFYSVGFGTDVDDEILSEVAVATGGRHVNQQDLSTQGLNKHFLSIAAAAADDTALIDPIYILGPGDREALDVQVQRSERNLTFALTWDAQDSGRFDAYVHTASGCTIATAASSPGVQVRTGSTYRLAKVELPYACQGKEDHAGQWTIEVVGGSGIAGAEDVQVIVFGSSRTHIAVNTVMSEAGEPTLTAELYHEGRRIENASIRALVVTPLEPQPGRSLQEDLSGEGFPYEPPQRTVEERTEEIELEDLGDGRFATALPVSDVGTYQIRVIAEFETEVLGYGRREAVTSAHFNGDTLIVGR